MYNEKYEENVCRPTLVLSTKGYTNSRQIEFRVVSTPAVMDAGQGRYYATVSVFKILFGEEGATKNMPKI